MKSFLVLVALLAAGCGSSNPAAKLVGKWDGTLPEALTKEATKGAGAMAANVTAYMQPKLELNADGTAHLAMGPMEEKGTWKVTGSGSNLELLLTLGEEAKAVPQPLTIESADHFTVKRDGVTIVYTRAKD